MRQFTIYSFVKKGQNGLVRLDFFNVGMGRGVARRGLTPTRLRPLTLSITSDKEGGEVFILFSFPSL
jgi:hypothetical protein